MYSEPPDLDRAALVDALKRHWRVGTVRLEYLPVGFGSHHWEARDADGVRWFVSADDLRAPHHAERAPADALALLERAFRTAVALRDGAGLEFVVAPTPSAGGSMLHAIGARYAIRVEPFVDGEAGAEGEFRQPEQRRSMGALVGRLHARSDAVPAHLPAWEDFVLPGRPALEAALERIDAPWDGGPFAEPSRALLRTHSRALRDRLGAHDRLAERLLDARGSWVVTHGEPHSANVIRERGGELRLVDWESVRTAPRERDLWMVLDADRTGWDDYRNVIGPVTLDEQALAFYRERWALTEICEYVALFGGPHDATEDTRAAWDEIRAYLP